MVKRIRPTLESAYDKSIDAGTPVLTGEQARSLVLGVAFALRHGNWHEVDKAHMVAAVESLNATFLLGIEKARP